MKVEGVETEEKAGGEHGLSFGFCFPCLSVEFF
jgi:hypothetical protein